VANENVRMSLALIEALKDVGAPVPVTFLSTANVPPAIDTVELSQKDSVDGYVLGKALCETLWLTAAHQRKFPVLVVRAVGAYGPRDTFSEDGNLIPALMLQARDKKDAMTVWGDGSQERAFLYVEDLIEVMMKLVEAKASGIQYVTTDDVVTVKELAVLIRDTVRPGLPIQFNPEKGVARVQSPTCRCMRSCATTNGRRSPRGSRTPTTGGNHEAPL
jgi:UDP-glucuronate decarboxylase